VPHVSGILGTATIFEVSKEENKKVRFEGMSAETLSRRWGEPADAGATFFRNKIMFETMQSRATRRGGAGWGVTGDRPHLPLQRVDAACPPSADCRQRRDNAINTPQTGGGEDGSRGPRPRWKTECRLEAFFSFLFLSIPFKRHRLWTETERGGHLKTDRWFPVAAGSWQRVAAGTRNPIDRQSLFSKRLFSRPRLGKE